MNSTPLPPLTPLPVLIKSSDHAKLDGVGTLITSKDTEITGLHVVSKKEALTHWKGAPSAVQRVCVGLNMMQRAQKERRWSVFQEALDVVGKYVPHFGGDAEIESIRGSKKWKEVGWAYSGLMSNLLHKAQFIIWCSPKDNRMRTGLFCPDWEVAVYAVVGMDCIRFCKKPACGVPFIPRIFSPDPNNDQKYCSPAHANADRVANCKAKKPLR